MRLVPLPVDATTARQLSGRLSEEYRIQVPVTASGDNWYLRIAAGPYNTADDYDRLADAVVDLTRH
jgi:hypothetical protein